MKENHFYHKNIIVARKNKFEKFDRDNYFRRDSKNLISIFLIGLYLGSGPPPPGRSIKELYRVEFFLGSIFEIFQFCGHEIKKSSQGNHFKFVVRVFPKRILTNATNRAWFTSLEKKFFQVGKKNPWIFHFFDQLK